MRPFVGSGPAGALLAGVLLLLPVACASTVQQPAAPSGSAPTSDTPTAPKVNRVVMGVVPPPEENNEPRMLNPTTIWPIRPMYEYPIGINPETGKLKEELATKWSLEPDGKSIRVTLRKGVQFQNGYGEVTARDFLYTWKDVTTGPPNGATYVIYFKNIVTDVETVNDYEVVYRTKQPDANFYAALSQAEAGMEIRSKANFDATGYPGAGGKPIAGTGPYQFKERALGQYVRYERTPGKHWRAAPDFPEFEFRYIKEPSTRLAALLADEIHLAPLPEDLLKNATSRGMNAVKGKVPGLRAFGRLSCCIMKDVNAASAGWAFPDSPMMDVRVRKALNKALNRDEINKGIFGGKGELMILNHFHPTRQGWNPDWEKRFSEEYGYDPAKARQLLADAGYTADKPYTTTMYIEPLAFFSGAEDLEEVMANYWRAVGIKVDLVQVDIAQLNQLSKDLKISNAVRAAGTSSFQLFGTTTWNTSILNISSSAEDPRVTKLMQTLWQTLDENKQPELWRQIGDLMFDQQLNIPLFWLSAETAVNPKFVAGYTFPGSITGTWTHVENIKAAR